MSAPRPSIFDALSREVALLCSPDGRVTFADARAERLLGVTVGQPLQRACAPGTEPKLRALLEKGQAGTVKGWELSLLVSGKPATLAFCAAPAPAPHEGQVALLGSLVTEDYAAALQQVSDTMGELGGLQRETARQKGELEEGHRELLRLNRALVDSNSGVRALHVELEDKAGALQRSAEVKSRLISSVSHEFRTPLHSILGLTQLLSDGADGPLGAEQQKQVRFIRSSAEELIQLVNDMLDLSKVEAGRASLHAERFTLSDFVSGLRGSLLPLLPADAAVKLVFEDPGTDVELETDRAKLSQVMRNLVSNALKFTERGEVQVTTGVLDGRVVLRVRDTGIGIAAGDQERIFEEFAQLEGPQQKKLKGTGLGLPIARGLAEYLGGTLTVQSAPGQGSVFTVEVPRVHHEVQEMHLVKDRSAQLDPARAPVLVVEDDRKTIFVYEKYLTMAGFQAIPARTVDEARQALQRVKPAAVVLDIMLEGEASWDFLAELKQSPETSEIPVLVVTITNREQKARALGADEFWFKPVDPDRLLRKLRSYSQQKSPSRVLVIDDDEAARYLVRKHLQGSPFQLLEAATGSEGVRLAQEQNPQVILLDFLLQEVTAFDVLDELKADPRTRPIPVIIITSHALDATDRSRLLEEADAVISKQHLSRELAINRIRDALRKAGLGLTA